NFNAISAKVGQYSIDAALIDNAHAFSRNTQGYKALFRFYPKTVIVQVRQKTTLGVVLCVRNIITSDWTLASHLTYFRHGFASLKSQRTTLCFSLKNRPTTRLERCCEQPVRSYSRASYRVGKVGLLAPGDHINQRFNRRLSQPGRR